MANVVITWVTVNITHIILDTTPALSTCGVRSSLKILTKRNWYILSGEEKSILRHEYKDSVPISNKNSCYCSFVHTQFNLNTYFPSVSLLVTVKSFYGNLVKEVNIIRRGDICYTAFQCR